MGPATIQNPWYKASPLQFQHNLKCMCGSTSLKKVRFFFGSGPPPRPTLLWPTRHTTCGTGWKPFPDHAFCTQIDQMHKQNLAYILPAGWRLAGCLAGCLAAWLAAWLAVWLPGRQTAWPPAASAPASHFGHILNDVKKTTSL